MNLYIGSNYHQVCDSKGPHNPAALADLPDGTTQVKWQPTLRQNSADYEKKWGGPFSWDNLYCWVSNPLPPGLTKIALAVDVLVSDISNLNAFEFESQVVRQKCKFNMAWQFRQMSHNSYTYDFANHNWIVAFPLSGPVISAGKLTRFCALYELLPDGPHHLGVQYGNTYTPVSIERPWVSTGEGDYLNFAFQFDSLNKGTEIDAIVGTRLIAL